MSDGEPGRRRNRVTGRDFDEDFDPTPLRPLEGGPNHMGVGGTDIFQNEMEKKRQDRDASSSCVVHYRGIGCFVDG